MASWASLRFRPSSRERWVIGDEVAPDVRLLDGAFPLHVYLSMILAKTGLGLHLAVSLGQCVFRVALLWHSSCLSACSLAARTGSRSCRASALGRTWCEWMPTSRCRAQALTDLKVEDFQVFEDDKLQKIENFELVTARAPIPQSERTDPDQRARHESGRRRCRACVHALPRRDAGVAGRLVSRPEADHRSARSHGRSRRSHRGDDVADLALVGHLWPPHVEHRANDHRQLDLGHTRPDRASRGRRRKRRCTPVMATPRGRSSIAFARSRRSMPSRGSSITWMDFAPNESSC